MRSGARSVKARRPPAGCRERAGRKKADAGRAGLRVLLDAGVSHRLFPALYEIVGCRAFVRMRERRDLTPDFAEALRRFGVSHFAIGVEELVDFGDGSLRG